jgi:hypothetical protein
MRAAVFPAVGRHRLLPGLAAVCPAGGPRLACAVDITAQALGADVTRMG